MLRRPMIVWAWGMLVLGGCAAGAPSLPNVTEFQRSLVQRIPFRAPVAASVVANSDEMRVMSFNLRTNTMFDVRNGWRGRRNLIVGAITQFDPDILATQECEISQARDLNRMLPSYGFVGVGRNDGWDEGEMCSIFYRRSRFHKIEEGHFWLSETPQVPGSKGWGSTWPRMVTWVKLQPHRGGDAIYVFNTHLAVASADARINGAKLIQQRIDQIAGRAPVILAGDFNAGEGSSPYQQFISNRRWVDTYRNVHRVARSNEGTRHKFRGGTAGERIDWILATRDFSILDADIVRGHARGKYPSDHFPVTAVLRHPRQWSMNY